MPGIVVLATVCFTPVMLCQNLWNETRWKADGEACTQRGGVEVVVGGMMIMGSDGVHPGVVAGKLTRIMTLETRVNARGVKKEGKETHPLRHGHRSMVTHLSPRMVENFLSFSSKSMTYLPDGSELLTFEAEMLVAKTARAPPLSRCSRLSLASLW